MDRPSATRLKLDAEGVESFLRRAFPTADAALVGAITVCEPGRLVMTLPESVLSLRPGGIVSGPTQMGLADRAVYALVAAHIGDQPMAVTTSLTMHFLRPCLVGALSAETRLLRLGRRIATADVLIRSSAHPDPCAQATVAYALPEMA